jgi:hypothetical protein
MESMLYYFEFTTILNFPVSGYFFSFVNFIIAVKMINIKHDLLGNLKFVHDYACIIRPHPLTPPPKIKGKTKTNVLIDRHCLIKIFSHNMKKIVTIIQKFKFSLKIVILKLEKKNVRIFLK